jgi:hypothetical protein
MRSGGHVSRLSWISKPLVVVKQLFRPELLVEVDAIPVTKD